MNICIDARWIFREISGVGAYTQALVRELAALDRTHTYTLLFHDPALADRTAAETGFTRAPNFSAATVPYGVFSPHNQLALPGFLKHGRFDLFHATNYMIPLAAFPRRRPGRTLAVTTIHDVIPLLFRDHAPRSRKSRLFPMYRRIMIEVGARSDAVITVSEASRRDLIDCLRIRPAEQDKVISIHNGVSAAFHAPPPERKVPPPNAERTLLYVGRADPYKNVCMLLNAFAACRKTCPFPLRLVIAGSPDPRYPEPAQLAARLGVGESVRWTGYLTHEALVRHYDEADLLVHPSRYEGFGLQLIEAMARGLPVVCTTGGSQPEVAGDAALMTEPDDTEGFAALIQKVLTGPDLYAGLSSKGLQRARSFTWQRAAAATRAVYEQTYANRKGPDA